MKNKLYVPLIVITLLFLLTWTGQSAGQRSSAARQSWEYEVEGAPTFAGPGSFVDPDKAQQLLNERGAQGWELISVSGGQPLFYFRRAR
ncbi:MAG: hypothetical protein ABI923_08685 [bacterium]